MKRKSNSSPKTNGRGPAIARRQRRLQRSRVPVAKSVAYVRNALPFKEYQRCELLATITVPATAPFTVYSALGGPNARINPGNAWMFPWLSHIAPLYEKYRFQRLRFRLVAGNPSTTSGRIYLAVDTDPNDNAPADATTMLANENAVANSVWEETVLDVNTLGLNQGLQWRFTGTHDSSDVYEPRTSYAGQLVIATQGISATCTWELFVEYDVALSVEQLPDSPLGEFNGPSETVPAVTNSYNSPYYVVQDSSQLRTASDVVYSGLPGTLANATGQCFDIRDIKEGLLIYEGKITDAGLTPAALVPAGSYPDMYMLDAAGNYLNVARAATGMTQVVGKADSAGTWAAGQPARCTMTVLISALRALAPTVRYLIPLIFTTAATAISVASHHLRFLPA